MDYKALREELAFFYKYEADRRADSFYAICKNIFDSKYDEKASGFSMKKLLYKTIAENVSPVLFENDPFYYETGTLRAKCSGVHSVDGVYHAGTLLYQKRKPMFREYDPEAYDRFSAQKQKKLYLVCGPYCDVTNHFPLHMRTVLKNGLSGIYESVSSRLRKAATDEEKEFLESALVGLTAIKTIQEKFAKEAEIKAQSAIDDKLKAHWERILCAAKHAPWHAPRNIYEALSSYALMRNCVGTLEAISIESFGRLDVDLYPFYKRDIEQGVLSKDEAYELICQFLLTWDLHFDHNEIDSGFWINDTFTVGGCDREGDPVCNDVTLMLLKAHMEEKILTPKIMCRFSDRSPKEYLDAINKSFLDGAPTRNYTNDNLIINAQIKNGRSVEDARDYVVVGCWEISTPDKEKADVGTYFHILKPFEYAIHKKEEIIQGTGLEFLVLEGDEDFEELYRIVLNNIRVVFEERAKIIEGRCVWKNVSPMPIYSSLMHSCIDKAKDFTDGGAEYNDDQFLCFGFPDLVDSLTVIKQLCFEQKKYTLGELISALRNDWVGADDMRADALHCNCWGDGSGVTDDLAKRLHNDIYSTIQNIPYSYMRDRLGGRLTMGHLNYNESVNWGLETLATPNGRRNGEHIAQGLTPTGYSHSTPTSAIGCAAVLDEKQLSAGSIITVMLPLKNMNFDIAEAMVRAAAKCNVGSFQFSCLNKNELIDAQKHPDRYANLLVRVCGFSAKFTSLSKIWQDDIISKCIYE